MKEDDEQFENEEEGQEIPFQIPENLDDILENARSFEFLSPESREDTIPEMENRQPRKLDEKEVKVMGVYEHQEQGMAPGAFVLLRDNLDRKVIIWIGRFEAYAISVALEHATLPRPMTHDLLKSMVDRLGGKVERIIIDDLWQDTYYAKVSISTSSDVIEVDSRPSDAIALGLRANAPIYMAEYVLERSAITEEL